MINVPNLSWVNTPNGKGPVAQVAANFLADTSLRIRLSGGILDKNVAPQAFTVDNLSNNENVTITINGVATVIPANVRQLFPLAPDTVQLDVSCTGNNRTAATIVFYADSRDAPPEQPNYAGLITRAVAAALIPGFTMWWPGPIVPSAADWLTMDGTSFTTAGQPNLFSALGYTWGGLGANFNVPDARGRTLMGASPGGLLNRPSVRTLGTSGGFETHTQTIAEMASHDHFVRGDGGGGGSSGIAGTSNGGPFGGEQTGAQGGGGAMDIMNPYIVGTWLIHT